MVLGVLVRHATRQAFLCAACEVHLESAVPVVAEHALAPATSAGSINWQICQLAGLIHLMHCQYGRAEAVHPVGQCIELASWPVRVGGNRLDVPSSRGMNCR